MLTARKTRRVARPQVELLDDRTLLSAGMTGAAHAAIVEARVEARHEILEAKIATQQAANAMKLANKGMFQGADAKAMAILAKTPNPASISSAVAAGLFQAADAQALAILAKTAPPSVSSPTPLAPTTSVPTAVAVTSGSPTLAVAVTAGVATTPTTNAVSGSSTPTFTPSSTDVSDAQNGPLAKAGGVLVGLYQDYTAFIAGGGTAANFTYSGAKIEVSGGNVGVDLGASGDLAAYEDAVTALGMTVQHVDSLTGTVEGLLPINQLLAVAQMSTTASVSPIYTPILR